MIQIPEENWPSCHEANYVQYDNVYIYGTLNYPRCNLFYDALEYTVDEKIKQQIMYPCAAPTLNITVGSHDGKLLTNQTAPLFRILDKAVANDLVIESTIVDPASLDGWVGRLVRQYTTPGHHRFKQGTYMYTGVDNAHIIDLDTLHQKGLCDIILLRNGQIKTL